MKILNYLRNLKFYNLSFFDFLSSFSGIYIIILIYNYFSKKEIIDITIPVLLTIPLGILVHTILRINTPLNQLIFSNNFNFYKVFLIINIFLLFLAIRNIYFSK